MGAAGLAMLLPDSELAVRNGTVPVLSAIEMPEIEVALRAAADAASSKAAKRHAVPRTIVEIAGVADGVGLVPPQAEWSAPAGLRNGPRHLV